ncbi:MAG: hypothetical protein Q8755_03180 [Candidatus Phytoplasma australasiaticum]|nr:hypothetical protein [Candidatus Phytoplasma australasiaticum]
MSEEDKKKAAHLDFLKSKWIQEFKDGLAKLRAQPPPPQQVREVE